MSKGRGRYATLGRRRRHTRSLRRGRVATGLLTTQRLSPQRLSPHRLIITVSLSHRLITSLARSPCADEDEEVLNVDGAVAVEVGGGVFVAAPGADEGEEVGDVDDAVAGGGRREVARAGWRGVGDLREAGPESADDRERAAGE